MTTPFFELWAIHIQPEQVKLVQEKLAERWSIRVFDQGDKALATLDQGETLPSLVMIDVGETGKEGFAICRQLRKEASSSSLKIIFLSENHGYEIKLMGLDAGCDVFLPKPLDAELLHYNVQLMERALNQYYEIDQELSTFRNVAFDAMANAGELGVVIDFMRASLVCSDERRLCALILENIENGYGLQGSVRLRQLDADPIDFDHGGETSNPLVSSVLDSLQNMDRIFSFEERLCLNYADISLLIHNMPVEEGERFGRLRDHLAIMCEAAANQLQRIRDDAKLATQTAKMTEALHDIAQLTKMIEVRNQSHRADINESLTIFYGDIQKMAEQLALNEVQKTVLIHKVGHLANALLQITHRSLETNIQIQTILDLSDSPGK